MPIILTRVLIIVLVLLIRLDGMEIVVLGHERRARVPAPQPNPGLGKGIAVGFYCFERHLSLW
jgi:hypothetical protein